MTQNRLRRSTRLAPQRAGEPNVLSNAAVPNQLSSMAPRPGLPVPGKLSTPTTARPLGRPLRQPVPGRLSAQARTTTDDEPTARRRRFSTGQLIAIAFLVYTVFRFIGQAGDGTGSAPAAPTTQPAQATRGPVAPGSISFGVGLDNDCGIVSPAAAFGPTDDVWWRAELSTPQTSKSTVVVIMYRNSEEDSRETVPPNGSATRWSVLCSGGPIENSSPARYRVEVWDEQVSVMLAIGAFTRNN